MKKLLLSALLCLGFAGVSWGQCGTFNYNYLTDQFDCAGTGGGGGGGGVTGVIIQGTSNTITVSGTCSISTTGTCTITIANPFVFPGKATFAASGSSAPNFNFPSGSAPTTPAAGDFWRDTVNLHFYDGTTNQTLAWLSDLATIDTDGTLAANSDTKVASQKATKTYADTKVPGTLDTDGTLAANSDTHVASQKATKTYADTKVPGSLDTDGALAANSDTKVASQKATKTYADTKVAGTLDTDGTLAANSDTHIPSQKAVKTYVASQVGGGSSGLAVPGTLVTPPSASAFTVHNSAGTPSLTDTTPGTFVLQASSGISSLVSYTKARTGSGDMTVVIAFTTIGAAATGVRFGLVLRESATDKQVSFGSDGIGSDLFATHYSSGGTYVSDPISPALDAGWSYLHWVKIALVGSTLHYSASSDGVNFIEFLSEAVTGPFTTAPDQWGYGIFNAGTSTGLGITIISASQT